MILPIASTSRLTIKRCFTTSRIVFQKQLLQASTETPTPTDLITKIGRGAEKTLKADSWESLTDLWRKGTSSVKDMAVKDRRYVLWALSKYSQGFLPSTFVSPPKPPKKYRGWGPRVQKGKRMKN